MLAGGDMQMTKSSLGKVMTHKWTPKNWTVGTGADKHRITFDLYLDTFFGQSSIKVPGYTEMKAVVTQVSVRAVSDIVEFSLVKSGDVIFPVIVEVSSRDLLYTDQSPYYLGTES